MKYNEIDTFKPNGYILNSVYAREENKNGGVMIMYNEELKSKNINFKTEQSITS